MQEEFIAWIWQNRLFQQQELFCESGEPLEILHPGMRNGDSGPDYFNAKLRIGDMVWIGNVELHVKASDWLRHKHHYDAMYENVILHVVHEHDAVIYRRDGTRVPELALRNRYEPALLHQYLDLIQGSAQWMPCEKLLSEVSRLNWHQWLARVMTERLEERCKKLEVLLQQTGFNWEEAFYRVLARAFGFRVNNDPFEMLAASLPLQTIRRHAFQHGYCEALLFGQAGFLEKKFNDAYARELTQHYQFLKIKNQLQPMHVHLWKFGRLRPANFPTRRIAQFTALLKSHENLFSSFVHCEKFDDLVELLRVEPDGYWMRHYRFDEEIPQSAARLGARSAHSLIINAVVPLLFYYGRYHGLPDSMQKALNWLEKCAPEDNAIIRGWSKAGVTAESALESQALLSLRKDYCNLKKCVNCGIGQEILQQK